MAPSNGRARPQNHQNTPTVPPGRVPTTPVLHQRVPTTAHATPRTDSPYTHSRRLARSITPTPSCPHTAHSATHPRAAARTYTRTQHTWKDESASTTAAATCSDRAYGCTGATPPPQLINGRSEGCLLSITGAHTLVCRVPSRVPCAAMGTFASCRAIWAPMYVGVKTLGMGVGWLGPMGESGGLMGSGSCLWEAQNARNDFS